MISILTATYNRAPLLPALYESLKAQSDTRFEWIVVDDGSTDDTPRLLARFRAEGSFPLRILTQPNGGKHRAVNRAVREAKGELVFIVDSDDTLTPDAIARIRTCWKPIAKDRRFAGVVGLKALPGDRIAGGDHPFLRVEYIDTDLLSYRMKYRIPGDRAEVFRRDVLLAHPFPEYPGERFCPEALVWNRIARSYKMRYFNNIIYRCDYRADGLTARIVSLRHRNCRASLLYYSELAAADIPAIEKWKARINYWRFAFSSEKSFSAKIREAGTLSLAALPLAALLYWADRKNSLS